MEKRRTSSCRVFTKILRDRMSKDEHEKKRIHAHEKLLVYVNTLKQNLSIVELW